MKPTSEGNMAQRKVYEAIANVARAIGETGIAKTSQNAEDGYAFRSIDDIRDRLSPLLVAHKLLILPTALERECVERRAMNGMPLFYVTVKVRHDFISVEDGSVKEVVMFGEAMDVADKATNKAMSAAYKCAVTEVFCIPSKGDNDADSKTHAVAQRMPECDRVKHERAILAAPDAAALKRAFTNATAASKRAGDEESRKTFVAAKETRTKQLAEAAPKKADAPKTTEKAAA